MDPVAVGRIVREARNRRGESLRALADRVGVSYQHIWKIEAGGNYTVDALERVLPALGLAVIVVPNDTDEGTVYDLMRLAEALPRIKDRVIRQSLIEALLRLAGSAP